MAEWICEQCNRGFSRKRSGMRRMRFCSQTCYHAWRKEAGITTGQFEKESVPWNKGKTGIHLSPSTEFKTGRESETKQPIGSTRIRTTRRDNKPRAFVKVAQPNIWRLRCHVVWERHFGPIPKGLLLHHLDRDTLNDSITNLVAMSRAIHLMDHRNEFEEKRYEGLCRSLSARRSTRIL